LGGGGAVVRRRKKAVALALQIFNKNIKNMHVFAEYGLQVYTLAEYDELTTLRTNLVDKLVGNIFGNLVDPSFQRTDARLDDT
jgi:hypothetical protein